jgi:chaperonin GroES
MIKVEPIGDRVVAERIEAKPGEERHGSLYIPDTAKDAPLLARVVAVGPGRTSQWPGQAAVNGLVFGQTLMGTVSGLPLTIEFQGQPMQVAVGDLVIYGRYSGAEIPLNINGKLETVFMLRQDEIMGIVRGVTEDQEPKPATEQLVES